MTKDKFDIRLFRKRQRDASIAKQFSKSTEEPNTTTNDELKKTATPVEAADLPVVKTESAAPSVVSEHVKAENKPITKPQLTEPTTEVKAEKIVKQNTVLVYKHDLSKEHVLFQQALIAALAEESVPLRTMLKIHADRIATAMDDVLSYLEQKQFKFSDNFKTRVESLKDSLENIHKVNDDEKLQIYNKMNTTIDLFEENLKIDRHIANNRPPRDKYENQQLTK